MIEGKNILLIVSGGIAAYKALDLIRLIRKDGATVRCILTRGGARFVTPLSLAALSENQVYEDIFSLKDETEMGHIRLSRESDLIVIAPASANMIARMANGIADDLAATVLLAADKPVLIAPAMNHRMWSHPATQMNIATLAGRGVAITGPVAGDMACGETGMGRMAEPTDILAAIGARLGAQKALSGISALVTSGPTHEPIDPVRFIGNRSSGKQGHAIAAALAAQGAAVTLVTGPVSLPDPPGIKTVHVQTAVEMLDCCRAALPVDVAICAAAVSDWSAAAVQSHKIKKRGDRIPPDIRLKENPDILAMLATVPRHRPHLVIGFAAETENLIDAAKEKRAAKRCDWILANDVAARSVFGAETNKVFLIDGTQVEEWPQSSKTEIAQKLATRIAEHMQRKKRPAAAAAE